MSSVDPDLAELRTFRSEADQTLLGRNIMPTTENPPEQYERSSCACQTCVAGCKTMPGYLIPSDIDRIGESFGVQEENLLEFAQKNLVASEGATVGRYHPLYGRVVPIKVPTIVPRSKPDGSCVFLDSQDRCTIHAVSPYGCRVFSACGTASVLDDEKSMAGLRAIMEHGGYQNLWNYLNSHGAVAAPLAQRRTAFLEMIRGLEAGSERRDGDPPAAAVESGTGI